jgi:hypothetical protein
VGGAWQRQLVRKGVRGKSLVIALALLGTSLAATAPAQATLHTAQPQVAILSVDATPHQLGVAGGTTTVKAFLQHATTCQIRVIDRYGQPDGYAPIALAYASNVRACASTLTARITTGANPEGWPVSLVFALVAHNKTSVTTRDFRVAMAGPSPSTTTTTSPQRPVVIVSVDATPHELGPAGGTTTVQAFLQNATTCQLSDVTDPYGVDFVFASNVRACSTTFTAHISFDANVDRVSETVTFALVAHNKTSRTTRDFKVVLAAPPAATTTVPAATTTVPAATTTVPAAATTVPVVTTSVPAGPLSLSITSSAPGNVTSSLNVSYTATVNGSPPPGTVTWEVVGGDEGGNFMYPSDESSSCTSRVGNGDDSSTCGVDWNTYGDQEIEATYTTSSGELEQTLWTRITSPIDMGDSSYSTYQNAGPGDIGDCMMAAAADWIQTTFNVAPSSAEIVSEYWDAEDQYNGGADDGLTASQLFTYWEQAGIGGTTLTGLQQIAANESAVETELSEQYVLLSTVNLPAGYPLGDGQGGGHGWVIVGYSSYGPVVVTWGQEVQISWADFSYWTTGVWALGTTQPSTNAGQLRVASRRLLTTGRIVLGHLPPGSER